MYFLALAVLCSVIVSVLLKIARRNDIVLEQAIALNYVMAFILNFLWFKPSLPNDLSTLPWTVFLALGVLLPSVFIIMGRAVEYAGIAKSDIAQRLSLVLPIIAAVTIFGEQIAQHKMIGVVLAFIALFCLLAKSKNDNTVVKGGTLASFILIGVWLGYGVIDILFKQLSKAGSALPVSLAISFGMGFVLMTLYITIIKKQRWTKKSIIGGLILGIFNFFNILFYIKAHQFFKTNPTLVFAAMNLGVITLGTITGTVFFREKLRVINMVGLLFAVAAIVMLFYGEKLL